METSQFEAVKVQLKQDGTGYILTLRVHPDEIDERILRDFVGARYQVVMVRLTDSDEPMVRSEALLNPIQLAGTLCRNLDFIEYLFTSNEIEEPSEAAATNWLRLKLGVQSRAELKTNREAVIQLRQVNKEFQAWKNV